MLLTYHHHGAKGVSLLDLRSHSPEYVFTFFHSRRNDVAIPATRVLRTTLHRFSALAVPPASPPSARPCSTCALRRPCARPFLSHQGQPPSRCVRRSVSPSAFGPALASRTNARRWGAPLPYRGALLRCPVGVPVAVRYGTPRVTPTRYDGGGPVLLFAVAWTCRCARSVQRDPASPGRGDASPGPGGRSGVGVARISEGVRLRLSGSQVRRSACTYTGRSPPAAPPGHAPVPGMTLAFAPTQRVGGSCGETWGWSNRARAQRPRSRPVDRYDMCIGTGKPAPRPPPDPRLPSHHPGVRTHDRDAPSVRYDGAGSVGRRTRGASPSPWGRTPARWWWSSVRGRGAAPSART